MTAQQVSFKSGGIHCAADLYLPEDYKRGTRRAALVIGHGFSIVKEALVEEGRYFSQAGYVTLAVDYRTFGDSEGEPRGQLFPLNEVEDFRNAISYLQSRDEVDPQRIGIWGTSFGGAVVIYTAAFDRRAKTVVAQVPVVNGRSWMKLLRASAQWLELLDRLDEDRLRRFRTGEGARVPVTGRGDRGEFCAMPSDEQICSFFEQARGSLKTWRPDLTLESVEKIIEFFPENVIHLIAPRPICIVTSAGYDMVHPIDTIQEAYRKAGEPKKLVLLPCDQLGAYSEPGRGMAMKAAIEWFDKYV